LLVEALIEASRRCHYPTFGIRETILGVVGRHAEVARERFLPATLATILPRPALLPIRVRLPRFEPLFRSLVLTMANS
jgi:hypothetical protein